ncbi:MAG: hypothetical protein LJE68_19010 [Rhodobacter sp.]|nr:hypothetical protein [Rhodobacter sp.]
MFRRILFSASLALAAALTGSIACSEELVMVEEHGCYWCALWNRDVSEIYPKTPEGQFAPLRRVDIHAPLPEDLQLVRAPFFTPTFILVRDGKELARIEGYPGEAFFWGLLGRMLQDNTDYPGAS